jgi:hypothetical protein
MGGRGAAGGKGRGGGRRTKKHVAAGAAQPAPNHADLNADERTIAQAYQRIAPRQYAYVSLTALRNASGLSRSAFDTAAASLNRKPGFSLAQENNQKTLTAADHADAVVTGGVARHIFTSSR